MNLAVPQSLYQTLQAHFLCEGKRMCGQLSKLLGIPEKELQQKLLKGPKVSLTIMEDSERPLSCLIPIQEDAIVKRCRRPCVLGTSRCMYHQMVETPEQPSETLKALTRLETLTHNGQQQTVWCDEETGILYNQQGNEIGQYEDEIVTLYSFDNGGA